MNKVYGGTVRHYDASSICLSCRSATVIETTRDIIVYCHEIYPMTSPMPQPVISCSSYNDRRHPTKDEYKKIGWVLDTNKTGEIIGFVNPKEWRERSKREGRDDDEDTVYVRGSK